MAKSSVERDLAKILFESDDGALVLQRLNSVLSPEDLRGCKDFYEVINKKTGVLNDKRQVLETAYQELLQEFQKTYQDSNTILNQLINNYQGSEEQGMNFAKDLLNPQSKIDQTLENKIKDFFTKYDNFFNTAVDSYEFLATLGEKMRNDKLLYAIGTDDLKRNADFHLLTKEGYGEMLKNNRALFGLTFTSKGKISNIEMRASVPRIQNAFTQLDSKDILSNLMDIKGLVSETSTVSFGDIWKILKDTTIAPENQGKLTDIGLPRKFELLLSGQFSGLDDTVGDITEQIKMIIDSNQGKINTGENFSGLASGDNRISALVNGQQIRLSIQNKLSIEGGKWHGIGVSGIFNAFNFYSRDNFEPLLEKKVTNPSDEAITEILTSYYGGAGSNYEAQLEDNIYTQIGQVLVDTVTENSEVQAWLSNY